MLRKAQLPSMDKHKTTKQKKQSRRRKPLRVQPISFLLKFCPPLPDVPESELRPREWAISKEELGG